MVSKSYKNLPIVSSVITEVTKQYVNVQTLNGGTKKVRWYPIEDEEIKVTKVSAFNMEPEYDAKEILGFGEKGYITVFKGDTEATHDWFVKNGRYSKQFGWYFPSNKEISVLPFNIEPIKISWDEVSSGNTLLSDKKIKEVIDSKIYAEKPSKFVGQIGEKIETTITVNYIKDIHNGFGLSFFHVMSDKNGNVFTWTTSTKKLVLGEKYKIVGTVKDYQKYHNEKQTVLSYCKTYFAES